MIDTLELAIPFDASVIEKTDGGYQFVGVHLKDLNINIASRNVWWSSFEDVDNPQVSELFSPYESLPTNFTGIASKVHLDGYFFPFLTIKCSPAKILQGHNVFGTDNLQTCVFEMLYWLEKARPELYSHLDLKSAEIRRIDITYTSKVKNPRQARQAIDFLSSIQNGQTKQTKNKKYETTAYWGGANSRLIRQKCYLKYDEFLAQIDNLEKQTKKGDSSALKVLQVMQDKRLIDLTKNSLRWECTFLKRYLERLGYSVNVWDFIKLSESENFFINLWQNGFKSIFDAIRGQNMTYVDDTEVLNNLKLKFGVLRDNGKYSYRKAINLYSFYNQLKAVGYHNIKEQKLYSNNRLNELIKDLCTVGFSKAYLQNLHKQNNEVEVIPFMRFIEIDFSNQVPDWYIEPISTPEKLALTG